MKTPLFTAFCAAALLMGTSVFAAPALPGPGPDDHRFEQGPGRRDDNYGYAQNHRVTPQEQARWNAAHRDDHFDRNQNFGFDRDHRVTRGERRHWEEIHNYGYAQNYRVSPQERARWEDSYRR